MAFWSGNDVVIMPRWYHSQTREGTLGEWLPERDLNTALWIGGYGHFFQVRNSSQILQFYVIIYLERDVRILINIKVLLAFEVFLGWCARRNDRIPNIAAMGSE